MDQEREAAHESGELRATLLNIAWLAIALGLVLEVIILGVAAAFRNLPGLNPLIADLVHKVSWSVIVCVGLTFGKAASKGQAAWAGLAGLLAAPLAFNIARTLHKGAAYALGITGPSAAASPLILGSLKGAEYAFLGLLLTWIGKQRWGGAIAHVGTGLVAGVIFGGAIVAIVESSAPAPLLPQALLSQAINEVLFPVGCSLAIFAAETMGKKSVR